MTEKPTILGVDPGSPRGAETALFCPICRALVRLRYDPALLSTSVVHDGPASTDCLSALRSVFLPNWPEGKAP